MDMKERHNILDKNFDTKIIDYTKFDGNETKNGMMGNHQTEQEKELIRKQRFEKLKRRLT